MKESDSTIADRINVSLVSFYGEKPLELCRLIEKLQTRLANHPLLQDNFAPYQLEQVHGTIIGCEGCKTDAGVVNQWFKQHRQVDKYVDFAGLINYFQHQADFPLTIRFGGYDRQMNFDFRSRDQHLYERSFQLQSANSQTIPVLIGWSWRDNIVTGEIDRLRRHLQNFNLLHKYHATINAIDNDFYLRLGTINAQLIPQINAIAVDLRDFLAATPLSIPLSLKNLAFVQYQDLMLTPATTKVIPVETITASQLEQLYSAGY
jgi:hypothetical protein